MNKARPKLIHLTPSENYESILKFGIVPTKYFASKGSELRVPVAYFILSHDIQKWIRWRFYLQWLIHHVSHGGKFPKIAVISIPIEDLPGNVRKNLYVIDRFPFQATQHSNSPLYRDPAVREIYPHTITPLDRYLSDKGLRSTYVLPEVISFSRVPLPDSHGVRIVSKRRLPWYIFRERL